MKFGDSYVGQPVYYEVGGDGVGLGYINSISVSYNLTDVYVMIEIEDGELVERLISDIHDAKGVY